jgi:hypothetical protein
MGSGDLHGGMELIFEAHSLGKFRPWLENPDGFQQGFYHLPNLLMLDQAFLVDLVGAVVSSLLLGLGASTEVPVRQGHVWTTGDYLSHHKPFRLRP